MIAPGTSGSPVFDDTGDVVAVVTSGDFVRGKNGMMRPSGTAANWAISAVRIRELLAARR
jgi:V8-like Glu-specific endopeptidase